jgi:hypothetical protein
VHTESRVGSCSNRLASDGSQVLHFNQNKADQQPISKDCFGVSSDLVKGGKPMTRQGCLSMGGGISGF